MNYGRQGIKQKKKLLNSAATRLRTKLGVFAIKFILILAIAVVVSGSCLVLGSVQGIISSAPDVSTIDVSPDGFATKIYDNESNEIQTLSTTGSNRISVELDVVPLELQHAFVAIEDERFYEHNGIDIRGIIRAGYNTITGGGLSQGASTLTQQLLKNNVFNAYNETDIEKIKRKMQEQYLAINAEKTKPKEEILTDYLNTINLGKGNLGVETASKYYFGKSAKNLTLSECAVLAGITKNPTYLNPVDYPEANDARRKLILKKMYQLNYISAKEYQQASEDNVYAKIKSHTAKGNKNSVYSYFTDALITQVVADLQEQKGYTQSQAYQLVYRGGLKIYSTQNTKLQKIADSVINNPDNYPVATKFSLEYKLQVTHADSSSSTYTEINVASYFRKKKKDPTYKTIYNSKKEMKAAVKAFRKSVMKKGDKKKAESIHYSMEPQLSYSLIDQKTGQVKVLVGGRGQKQDDLALNRATSVKRQPGSTFKILSTYAPAIDTGSMTLATVFDDAPYQYENGQKVTNYVSTSYKGLTTVRDAIIDSNNIVAVKALTDLTPQVGFDFLQKLGFTTLVNNRVSTNGTYESDVNQSLALGGITDGVTNVELTAAYAAIANQGTYNTPVLYTTVKDSNGNVLLSNKKKSRKVIKKSTAWLLTNAMEDVVKKGTGRAAQLDSDMAVAAKTGTTSNNYDYWFCGYTPYYTASVWTGYDYNTSFDNDEDYHKVIWKKIMDRIISEKKQKVKSFPSNKNIKKAEICIKTGKKALPNVCSKDPEKSMVRTEYFASGTVPKDSCDAHIAVTFCSKSHLVAQKFCPDKFRYTKIFRVRPKHSSHKTDDEPYFLNIDINNKCNIHTEEWHQKKLEKKKKKQEEKLKKQQKQQQSGNDTTDTSINNIEKQIKKLLN